MGYEAPFGTLLWSLITDNKSVLFLLDSPWCCLIPRLQWRLNGKH